MLAHVLPEIFENLSLRDILRCRQVCRTWRYVVERDFLKELCLYVRLTWVLDIWHIDGKPINERNVLTVNHLSVLSDPNFSNTFRNLKRLFIRFKYRPSFRGAVPEEELNHLNQLNCFHQLEHLELLGVPINKSFESKLSGLKKLFYQRDYAYSHHYSHDNRGNPLKKLFPQKLEILRTNLVLHQSNSYGGLNKDHLKVLILSDYSEGILQLVNLERLHLGKLVEDDEKPRVFVARFPKLLLLDILNIFCEKHMNEIQQELQELAALKATRSVQFYHQGFEVSNEQFKNPEMKLAVNLDAVRPCTDLKKLLSVASQNLEMRLPFCYFEQFFSYHGNYDAASSIKPIPFEILNRFANVHKVSIKDFESFEEIRNLLLNLRQISDFTIHCDHFDFQFFVVDLPKILKKLVRFKIFGELVFESLEFLNGFVHLLTFGAKFKENEQNQRITESIEQRNKNLTYPVLDADFYESLRILEELYATGDWSPCKNYLRF